MAEKIKFNKSLSSSGYFNLNTPYPFHVMSTFDTVTPEKHAIDWYNKIFIVVLLLFVIIPSYYSLFSSTVNTMDPSPEVVQPLPAHTSYTMAETNEKQTYVEEKTLSNHLTLEAPTPNRPLFFFHKTINLISIFTLGNEISLAEDAE